MNAARFVSQGVFYGLVAVAGSGGDLVAGMPAAEGSFDRTLAVTGPVDLDIRTGSGGIRIDTGATDTVHVVARILANYRFADPEGRVKQIEANPPIQQEGNTIRIGQVGDNELYRNVSIGYDVTVPAATRVHSIVGSGGQTIRHLQGPVDATAGSGGLRIEETTGEVHATTGSGGLRLTGVRGAVHARAGSGGILIEGQPLAPWDVRTGSGGIRMSVADKTPFELDANAGSGGISSSQPVTVIGVSSKQRLQGTVGGGGARGELSAGSGGIRIE